MACEEDDVTSKMLIIELRRRVESRDRPFVRRVFIAEEPRSHSAVVSGQTSSEENKSLIAAGHSDTVNPCSMTAWKPLLHADLSSPNH